jgi:hypothetical protein
MDAPAGKTFVQPPRLRWTFSGHFVIFDDVCGSEDEYLAHQIRVLASHTEDGTIALLYIRFLPVATCRLDSRSDRQTL